MPTAVQPSIEKILPKPKAQPKPAAPKADKPTFDEELNKAKPKPKAAPSQPKPEAKKPAKAAKPKKPVDQPKPEIADEQSSEAEVTDEQPTQVADEQPATDEAQPAEAKDAPEKPADKVDVANVEPNPELVAQVVTPKPQTETVAKVAEEKPDQPKAATKPVAVTQVQAETPETGAAEETEAKDVKVAKAPTDAAVQEQVDQVVQPQAEETEVVAIDENSEEESPATDDVTAQKPVKKTPANVAAKPVEPAKEAPQPVELGASPKTDQPIVASHETQPDDDTPAPQHIAAIADHDAPAADHDDAPAASAQSALAQAGDAQSHAKSIAPPSPAPAQPAQQQPDPQQPPEVRFADTNHPQIVTGMRGQLLPDGGTMHIRLDPPELGALQVSVHMQDGMMTATFQTSNDDATHLLSHSLAQLKHVLESQGVSVDKLHVTQAPRDQEARNDDNGRQQQNPDNPSARQEQQRREILNRMWRRLANGSDPLDMIV